MSTPSLTPAQLATVLAALRYYQEQGLGDPDNRPLHIHEIAADAPDVVASLDDAGIDELCEKLNFGSTPQASRDDKALDLLRRLVGEADLGEIDLEDENRELLDEARELIAAAESAAPAPSLTGHTPGPWIAQSAKDFSPGRHDDNRWTVHANGLPLIAVVEQYYGAAEANARLIAQAPALLRERDELRHQHECLIEVMERVCDIADGKTISSVLPKTLLREAAQKARTQSGNERSPLPDFMRERDELREALRKLRNAAMDTPALDSSKDWTDLITEADAVLAKTGGAA